MAEIVDFGLQQHKIKMDSRYFENVLSVVAGDTGRRIEVQLLDTNGMVQDTTGLRLRLNAEIAGKATYTDATLVDATTGKYQLDLSNGMFLAPGNWQFQWQITDSAGKKLHSFAFTGNVGKNISEGGSQATDFYLNLEDLKAMQDDLVNGTIDSSILETNITEKLTDLETQYAPKLTEVTAQLEQKINALHPIPELESLIADNVTDNTVNLQSMIDYLFTNGGGVVNIPTGKYMFEGTIKLKPNVSLQGATDFEPWNGNGFSGYENVTFLRHNPTVSGTNFLTTDQTTTLSGYFGGINVKNLYIEGSPNSNIGLKIENVVNGVFQNIQMQRFDTNIQMNGAMKVSFEKVSSMFFRKYGLYVGKLWNTTTSFYRCYFGQSRTEVNATPLFIENNSAIGIDFLSCGVESTSKGIFVGSGNTVSFNQLYTENVPAAATSDAVINIGLTDNGLNEKGTTNFIGGSLASTNGTVMGEGGKIFNVNYSGVVNVFGVKLARSENAIKYTANSKGVTFIGCYDMQISNNLDVNNTDGRLVILGNSSGSAQTEFPSHLRRFNMKTPSGEQYKIEATNTQTNVDLRFVSPLGSIPLWLDGKGNVRHNYTGTSNNMEKASLFGSVARPDFTGMSSSIKFNALWSEEVNGVSHMKVRRSDARIAHVGYTSATLRPVTPFDGELMVDKTLKKIIWYDEASTSWRDSMGAIV